MSSCQSSMILQVTIAIVKLRGQRMQNSLILLCGCLADLCPLENRSEITSVKTWSGSHVSSLSCIYIEEQMWQTSDTLNIKTIWQKAAFYAQCGKLDAILCFSVHSDNVNRRDQRIWTTQPLSLKIVWYWNRVERQGKLTMQLDRKGCQRLDRRRFYWPW